MRLRPDLKRTATGYVWLDWLTAPYWLWLDKRSQRAFFLLFGKTEAEGRRFVKENWDHHDPVLDVLNTETKQSSSD